jgi:hypothetical protein
MNTGFSELQDNEYFAVPMPGLFADMAAGVGSLSLPDEFHAAPARCQLDVIADWQRGLAEVRRRAFEQLYAEVRAKHRFASAAELRGHLDEACRELGQEWPPELGTRLVGPC